MTKVDDCLAKAGAVPVVFQNPVPTATQTWNNYGQKRKNSKGATYYHTGLDIPVPKGTDVVAAEYGVVWRIEPHETYGNLVVLKHSEELYTLYAHLDEVGVQLDNCVEPGDRLGASGNTGKVEGKTGEHLHFEIIQLPKSSKVEINRTDRKLGLVGDLTYRLDPTFIFGDERRTMLTVSHSEAFKSTKWPSLGIGAAAAGLAAIFDNGLAALVGGWNYLATAGVGFAIAGVSHLFGRQRMISKAEKRLTEVREQLRINVTAEMVQKQLQRAETTGQMSPLQRSKIYASMRRQVDAANSRVMEIDEKLDRVSYNVETLTKELDSVEADVRFAKTSIDAERLKSAEAKRQEIETKLAQQQEELSRLKKQAEAASQGTSNANERLMALQKAERKAGSSSTREGSGNERDPARSGSTREGDSGQGQHDSGSRSNGGTSDDTQGEPAGIILRHIPTGRSKKVSDPFEDEPIVGDQ